MKKRTSIKQHIDHMMERWPTMCGNNVLNALDHLLVCNGTGYDWREDGTTIEYGIRRDRPDPNPEKRALIHEEAFAKLRTMPDFKPITIWEGIGNHAFESRRALIDPAWEEALADWDLDYGTKAAATDRFMKRDDKDGVMDHSSIMYLERVCKRPSFYTLSLDRFSNVARMDHRAEPETVRACFEVLWAILSQPQGDGHHKQENHVNALIHLLQKRELFHRQWPGDDAVLSLRKEVGAESLRISSKEHVSNHKIDESVLTDQEYFWYHGLVMDGLSEEEIQLVRKFSFYLRWQKGYDLKRTEEGRVIDHKRRKAFWKDLKYARQKNGTYKIMSQTIDGDAAACLAVNTCIYRL